MHLKTPTSVQSQRGGVLVVSLLSCAVLGVALASTLTFASHQRQAVVRSEAWNMALPVAEAGVEEAMSHLHAVGGGNRAVNGWSAVQVSSVVGGQQVTAIQHRMVREFEGGRYEVSISPEGSPRITSTTVMPVRGTGQSVRRTVRITTASTGPFPVGVVAKERIYYNGRFMVDSYDSRNPHYSTDGQYDPAKRRDGGGVASVLRTPDAIELSGEVKIYGSVAVGPDGGVLLDPGSNAKVGSIAHVDGGGEGIETGKLRTDFNMHFPEVVVPEATYLHTTVNANRSNYLASGSYKVDSSLTLQTGTLVVGGNVTLLVPDGVDMAGQSQIIIEPGGSLQLYVQRGTVKIAGNGVANLTGLAENFALWGMKDVNDITVSGNGQIIGTLYAPDAHLKLSGGGNNELDFMGAAVVRTVQGVGKFEFHYDEALQEAYGGAIFEVVRWEELAAH